MLLGKHCPDLSFPPSKRPVRLHFIVAELQHLIVFLRTAHLLELPHATTWYEKSRITIRAEGRHADERRANARSRRAHRKAQRRYNRDAPLPNRVAIQAILT